MKKDHNRKKKKEIIATWLNKSDPNLVVVPPTTQNTKLSIVVLSRRFDIVDNNVKMIETGNSFVRWVKNR